MTAAILHLSIPISDVAASLKFYCDVLGCQATRVEHDRIDIEFFGHHLVAQLSPLEAAHVSAKVGNDEFPLRHFGVVVPAEAYDSLLARMRQAQVPFAMEPKRIFIDTPREQGVFLVYDPSGNAVEVKGLVRPEQVFSTT